MNEDEEIIAKDKQAHPDCGYSVSTQSTYSNTNGEVVSETIKSLMRMCPGKRPEPIYTKKVTDGSHSGDFHSKGPTGFGLFGDAPLLQEFGSQLDHFANELDQFLSQGGLGDIFRSPFGQQQPRQPQPALPPHRQRPVEDKPRMPGRGVGNIEEV